MSNQKIRTRKDLLRAASLLLKKGRKPTLDEVAEEAMVSRATAYRYFQGVDALLVEAALDIEVPEPEDLFLGDKTDDPVVRVYKVDDLLDEIIRKNETSLRAMLVNSIAREVDPKSSENIPKRQNRREPLIEAALATSKKNFNTNQFKLLKRALSVFVGTESMIVFKDVLRIDEREAKKVKRWAIKALVDTARKSNS